jgi:prepilin-type N-terminal cleavage/methylation domain-containing protein
MQIAVKNDQTPKRRVAGEQGSVLKSGHGAFTLLEIMIVVAIIGLVMAMSAPSFVRINRREGMQRGLNDFFEACRVARANAIMSGQVAELVVHPKTRQFEVTGSTSYSATFPDNVWIELLGVNFIELQNADSARVKFQPNATCDEFTMVLMSDDHQAQKISLEVMTGLVDLEVIR